MHKNNDFYYVKFDYKFYPVSAILRNYRYQGIYVGFGPGVYLHEMSYQKNDVGIALFASCGFQFFVNNRLSLSVDFEFNSVRQQNPYKEIVPAAAYHRPIPTPRSESPTPNEIADNFHITNSIKIGYIFNRPKNNKIVKIYD